MVVVSQLPYQLETLTTGVTRVSSKFEPINEVDLQLGAVLVDQGQGIYQHRGVKRGNLSFNGLKQRKVFEDFLVENVVLVHIMPTNHIPVPDHCSAYPTRNRIVKMGLMVVHPE